jgi:hypothetical protein
VSGEDASIGDGDETLFDLDTEAIGHKELLGGLLRRSAFRQRLHCKEFGMHALVDQV